MNKKQLRKKLALMLATLKKKRPYYCDIEYIESTGTQYIDTGCIPTNTTGVQLRHTICANNNKDNILFGCRENSGDTRFWEDVDWTNSDTIGWGFNTYSGTSSGYRYPLTTGMVGQTITSSLNFMNDRACKINGVSYDPNPRTATLTTITRPIYLFGANNQGSFGYANACKIFNCQISDGSTVVRDFIPVLDWNMTPCMYDKVSGELFYNQGTGDFNYGREIHYVDYLESTGTQYINTGYIPTSTNIKYDIHVYTPNIPSAEQDIVGYWAYQGHGSACVIGFYQKYVFLFTRQNNTSDGNITSSTYSGSQDFYITSNLNENNKTKTLSVNGVTITGSIASPHTIFSEIRLFCANTTVGNLIGRIYYCKILDGDILVRDFIPAIDENGVGFMFDRVSHTIYDNAGTGAFKYPPVELEYLQGTGTQYIDSGYIPTNSTGMKLSWTRADNTDRAVMGTRHSSISDTRFFIGAYSQGMYISWNTLYVVPTTTQINTFYETSMNYKNDRKRILDGAELSQITGTLASINQSIYLFWIPAATYKALSKIKYAQITEGSELVRDLIPCYKDGVLGMWDKVNDVFYDNDGTDTFIGGPVKEDEYE